MSNSPNKWIHPRHWQHAPLMLRQPCQRDCRSWLAESGSLTARLMTLATKLKGALHVDVLSEGWCLPSAEEARRLGLRRGEFAWVREVILLGRNTPWVQARSVLPRRSLGGLNRRLTRLGNQSLGSVLFRDPALQRGVIRYARLAFTTETVWARRSQFLLHGQAILVAEAFLPALLTASAEADTIAS